MSAEKKLKEPGYEEVAKRAAEEPSALIGALTDSGGEKQGGLTLTKEHILKIKHYSAYALTLPTTKEAAENWLGYTTISHPELQPSSMAALFSTIRAHASQWEPLVADNKTLAFQLKITAGDILASGLPLIAKCKKLIGDDKELELWQTLTVPESVATTTPLTEQQKKGFPIISRYIDHMQEVADKYITQVDEVVKKTQKFSGAFTELVRQVEFKQKAVGDYQKEEKNEGDKSQNRRARQNDRRVAKTIHRSSAGSPQRCGGRHYWLHHNGHIFWLPGRADAPVPKRLSNAASRPEHRIGQVSQDRRCGRGIEYQPGGAGSSPSRCRRVCQVTAYRMDRHQYVPQGIQGEAGEYRVRG